MISTIIPIKLSLKKPIILAKVKNLHKIKLNFVESPIQQTLENIQMKIDYYSNFISISFLLLNFPRLSLINTILISVNSRPKSKKKINWNKFHLKRFLYLMSSYRQSFLPFYPQSSAYMSQI